MQELSTRNLIRFQRNSAEIEKENYERGIISLGKDEIDEIIDDGKDIQTQCVFCGKIYPFTIDELKALSKKTTH